MQQLETPARTTPHPMCTTYLHHTPLQGLLALPRHSSSQQDKGSNLHDPDRRYGSCRSP